MDTPHECESTQAGPTEPLDLMCPTEIIAYEIQCRLTLGKPMLGHPPFLLDRVTGVISLYALLLGAAKRQPTQAQGHWGHLPIGTPIRARPKYSPHRPREAYAGL